VAPLRRVRRAHTLRGSRASPRGPVSRLRCQLRAAARPSDLDLRAYLGSPLPVLGVPAGALESIARSARRELSTRPAVDLARLAEALWRGSTYDERALAIVLLRQDCRRLGRSAWHRMDRWVDAATGWALSDALAGGPIAEIVAADRARVRELERWTRSENPWRRRAALYALSRRLRAGDLRSAMRVIDRLREDPEFWVQRAVGTWLRECWKVDERATRRYLRRHAARLPRVTLTVATERAPTTYRAALRAVARRSRRGPDRPTRPPTRSTRPRAAPGRRPGSARRTKRTSRRRTERGA